MNKPDLIEKQNRLAELKENNVSLKSQIRNRTPQRCTASLGTAKSTRIRKNTFRKFN